ncbi:hypothetical protein YC2023_059235 [Brassica napus]
MAVKNVAAEERERERIFFESIDSSPDLKYLKFSLSSRTDQTLDHQPHEDGKFFHRRRQLITDLSFSVTLCTLSFPILRFSRRL